MDNVATKKDGKKSGFFARWIERLAEASDRQYGGTPPSCCSNKPVSDKTPGFSRAGAKGNGN